MFKITGLSLIYCILFLGLYGCSCSEKSKSDDKAAGLYIESITVNEEDEGITEYEIAVNLQRDNQDTVTVNYSISALAISDNDVATGGQDASSENADFVEQTDEIVFSPDSSNTQTILFEVVNDTLYEHDEDFLVKLTGASGARIVASEAVVTIRNNDPEPIVSFTEVGDSGDGIFVEGEVDRIQLKASLNAISGVDAKFRILESREASGDDSAAGKTAAYRIDYLLKDASEALIDINSLVIEAGETEALISMDIIDDGAAEKTESFTLALEEVADVNVSGARLDFVVTDNDATDQTTQIPVPLNDTGVTEIFGINVAVSDLPPDITAGQIEFERDRLEAALQLEMDFSQGRDAATTLEKVGGGRAGFDFTRLDAEGKEIFPEIVPGTYVDEVTWDCVRDNHTGLIWEVKLRGNVGLRAASRDFHWYDPNFETNGGVAGAKGDFECAVSDLTTCNTSYYVADINASKLCGLSGWRLPTLAEIRSIIDYNISSKNVTIAYDTDYFAGDTLGTAFVWTSTTYAPDNTKAWAIRFGSGIDEEPRDKMTQQVGSGIRLVNDTLIKQSQQQ